MSTTYLGRKSNPTFTTAFPQEDISAHYMRNNTDSAYNVVYRYKKSDGTIVEATIRLQAGEIHPQQEEIITISSTTSSASIEYGELI